MFDRFRRQVPESEIGKGQPDRIVLPQGSPLRADLEIRMGMNPDPRSKQNPLFGDYPKRLSRFQKARRARPDDTEAKRQESFDEYKLAIRRELLRTGHVDRQLLAEHMRAYLRFNAQPAENFDEGEFNRAFDAVRDDIQMRLSEG